MSFVSSPASTSQHHESSQINFNSTSQNHLESIENRVINSDNFSKVPKSISNIEHSSNHLQVSFNYEKCFNNTFDYSANGCNYNGDNAIEFTSANQTFNNADQFGYNFNAEPGSEQYQKTSKFSIIIKLYFHI